MELNLKGKVAIVTGGGGVLGGEVLPVVWLKME